MFVTWKAKVLMVQVLQLLGQVSLCADSSSHWPRLLLFLLLLLLLLLVTAAVHVVRRLNFMQVCPSTNCLLIDVLCLLLLLQADPNAEQLLKFPNGFTPFITFY
jgi:hypothetical protein